MAKTEVCSSDSKSPLFFICVFHGTLSTTVRRVNLYKSGALIRFCLLLHRPVITWSCMRKTNHTPNFLPPCVSAGWELYKLGTSPRAYLSSVHSFLISPQRAACTARPPNTRIPGTDCRWRHERRRWCSKSWADLISGSLFLQKMSPRTSRATPPIALRPRS